MGAFLEKRICAYSALGPFNGTKEWQNWISEMERE